MNWTERPIKAQAREWLLEQAPSDVGINYLGLPADEAIFEKLLCEKRRVESLTLFEQDRAVYSRAFKKVFELVSDKTFPVNSVILSGSIDNYIEKEFYLDHKQHEFVWLDYCGPITPERLKSLRTALKLRPTGGVVAVTFMAGRERPDGNTILDFFDESYMGVDIDYNTELVPGYFLRRVKAVAELAKGVDKNMDIRVLPYKDHAPMMMFVFTDCKDLRPVIEIEPYLKE
jgi:hypothetical protein